MKAFVFVATLGYLRRLHVRAFRNEKQELWFARLESAFRTFGERDEAHRLKPLSDRPSFESLRELTRVVGNDCAVEVDTNSWITSPSSTRLFAGTSVRALASAAKRGVQS